MEKICLHNYVTYPLPIVTDPGSPCAKQCTDCSDCTAKNGAKERTNEAARANGGSQEQTQVKVEAMIGQTLNG
jgi:hypothetical protein